MGDLEVDDADVEIGGQGEDRRQHAFAVGDGQAELDQVLGSGHARRQVDPRPPRLTQHVEQPIAIAFSHDRAHLAQPRDQLVQLDHDGVAVLGADVGPDARMAGRDARHVAKAARGQPQHGAVLLGALGRQAHHRRRREVGHVRDHGHQSVVAIRGDGHHRRTETGDDRADGGEGIVVGAGDGREHPGRPFEQIGSRSVDALELGPGHGVAAHVAGIVHQVEHGRLDAPHVGDQPVGRCRARPAPPSPPPPRAWPRRSPRHRDRVRRRRGPRARGRGRPWPRSGRVR